MIWKRRCPSYGSPTTVQWHQQRSYLGSRNWPCSRALTLPLSSAARIEAGFLLRRLQRGDHVEMPHSRPMPTIGPRCHELRINDADQAWRIVYRIDQDAIVIADVFSKKTRQTPDTVIKTCQKRLKEYDNA
jgi:phage-related protein